MNSPFEKHQKSPRPITRRQCLGAMGALFASSALPATGCDQAQEDAGDGAPPSLDAGDGSVGLESSPIFSGTAIGALRLKNRLVRAATDDFYCVNGRPTRRHFEVMTELAAGGAGMIISGMTGIWKPEVLPTMIYAYDDAHVPVLAEIREAIGRADGACKAIGQIGHTGNRYWPVNDFRVGPSDVPWPRDLKPLMQELPVEKIEEIVAAFAQAVRRFKEAGWDGVELHGAHGYLISCFLSPYTNHRDDEYGGSAAKRVRIVRDIVEQSRALVGPDFPILIKVNSADSPIPFFTATLGTSTVEFEGGITREIFLETAQELDRLPLDAIEVSANNPSQEIGEITVEPYFEEAAAALEVGMPVILTGGNRGVDAIERLLATGEVALFGMARPFIREPDLPAQWLRGEKRSCKCVSCNLCIDRMTQGVRCHQEPQAR